MIPKKALLFDLDGTLLPMDREEFVRAYLPEISAAGKSLGDPRMIADSILKGSYAMVKSTSPEQTLEQVFWVAFERLSGISRQTSEAIFDEYYRSSAFDRLQTLTPAEPLVPEIIAEAKRTGLRLILATSPMFPRVAIEKRVVWAGIKPDDFEHITTYEQYHAAKPHRLYFEEILGNLGLTAGECIMIGNDAREDLPAPTEMGMETFLLLDHAIIPEGLEYRCDHKGKYADLLEFIRGYLCT